MSDSPYQLLTGDPGLLTTKANHYERIAEAISRSVTTLRKIHQVDEMKSEATTALRDGADDVAHDIDKAQARYATTASALKTYASQLRTAQDDAAAAIAEINEKEQTASAAATAVNSAHDEARTASHEDKAEAKSTVERAERASANAKLALAGAHDKWYAALKDKNDAAQVAQSAIEYVVDGKGNHGLKDEHHWYDSIVDFAKAAYKVFKKICDIAGVLAIFLSWVPGLGEVLLALAAIGAVLDLIEAGFKLANGEGSWGDFLMAGAGAVLTVFGGKLLSYGAKGVKGMLVGRAGARMASQGERGTAALARLQGVGAHSTKFMSTTEAAAARDAVGSFSSLRTTAVKSFKESLNPGAAGASRSEIFASSMKDSFGRMRFSGDDLSSAWRMAVKDPSLLTGKNVIAGLTVTAGYAGSDALKLYGSVDALRSGDYLAMPGVGDGYSKMAGLGDDLKEFGEGAMELKDAYGKAANSAN